MSDGATGSTGAFGVRRRALWIAPIAIVLVAGLGAWAYTSVERSQKQQRRDELQALLRASVEGITTWFSAQELLASSVAADPGVVEAVLALIDRGADASMGERPARETLRERLALLMTSTRYEEFTVARALGHDG